MAYRYPAATFRPIGALPPSEPKMTGHDIICVHTMVGTLWGTDSFFRDQGWSGTESHYGVGGDGETLQWVPLDYQADANLHGNPTVISVENADKGPGFPTWTGSDVPLFTPDQVNRLVDLIDKLCRAESHADCPATWRCHREGIPRTLIPDTLPGRRGIGWHRQGINPWRVDSGVLWSDKTGKVCPGDRRIAQLQTVIAPRVAALAQEDDMTPDECEAVVRKVVLDAEKDGGVRRELRRLAQYVALGQNNPAFPPETFGPGTTNPELLAAVQAVTAGDPVHIAQMIATALGPELAKDVADELHARLAG